MLCAICRNKIANFFGSIFSHLNPKSRQSFNPQSSKASKTTAMATTSVWSRAIWSQDASIYSMMSRSKWYIYNFAEYTSELLILRKWKLFNLVIDIFISQQFKKFIIHHNVHVLHQLGHKEPVSVGYFVFIQSNFLDDFSVVKSLQVEFSQFCGHNTCDTEEDH